MKGAEALDQMSDHHLINGIGKSDCTATIINSVMKIRVPEKAENFLSS
jgi:hypothetical protein